MEEIRRNGCKPEAADALSVESEVLSIRLCDRNIVAILDKDTHRRSILLRIAAAKHRKNQIAQMKT